MLSPPSASRLLNSACRPVVLFRCRHLSSGPKVCVVGSGPSAFYFTQHVLKNHGFVSVDMFEKLPAPFGLVRYGVAPDHPEVKNVINTFTEVAKNPRFNFFGNVTVGKDIRLHELQRAYAAVVLAYGASTDRRLGVPGEDIPGVLSAREFVGWYNGAPYSELHPDLNCDTVAVVGIGNVALDVARILLSPISRLKRFDIPEPVLATLSTSKIRRVVLIGRRGPLQAAFTLKEVRELSRLPISDNADSIGNQLPVTVLPSDIFECTIGDKEDIANLLRELPRPRRRLTQFLLDLPRSPPSSPSSKICDILFLRSPVRIVPKQSLQTRPNQSMVDGLELTINQLEGPPSEHQRAIPILNRSTELLECGLVVRSIGYKSVQIDPDIPFDEARGVIKSKDNHGRVAKSVHKPVGADDCLLYCTGWAKRGSSGVIIDTSMDARDTARTLLIDLAQAELQGDPRVVGKKGLPVLMDILHERHVHPLAFADWERVDAMEKAAGKALGKSREKLTSVEAIMNAAFADAAQHRGIDKKS
ncbi:unnamed protein product [Calicophoron daubneyi]|uniref:NADPH:adrenodoxin oxidoreductase, mitochondrial n=1 Tax=Calicophoron daubneyi TaxID=300641 RepID=A0AAV2T4D4_CALDB